MTDVERSPSVAEQHEDKEAILPLTPVSDGDGFKHGEHEDHLDASNGTPVPSEPAHEAELEKSPEPAEMDKPVENKPTPKAPTASASPMRPKAAVSAGARVRTTSMATGKPDPKTAATTARKTATTKPTPAPTAASKRASLTPSTASKPVPSRATASSAAAAAEARARRTSVAPAAGHASKPSVSKPTSTRTPAMDAAKAPPARAAATKTTAAPVRGSITSPTSSGAASTARATPAARPRVSDSGVGVVPARRVGSVKLAPGAHVRSPTPRSMAGSPAPKHDEAKHNEIVQKLEAKELEVSSLSERINQLQDELAQRQSSIVDLQKASEDVSATKDILNTELQSLKDALESANVDKDKVQSALEETKKQLDQNQANLDTKEFEFAELDARVQELENTITELRSANEVAQSEITKLTEQTSTQQDAAAAAAIDHDALVKARDDLKAIHDETEALRASHNAYIEQLQLQIKELETQLSAAESTTSQLRSQISTLESEKEEFQGRISELEIEILEAKEALEVDADHHAKELVKLNGAHSKAVADLESRHQEALAKAESAHQEAVKQWEEDKRTAEVNHAASLDSALNATRGEAEESRKQALVALEQSHAKVIEDLNAKYSQELTEAKEAHKSSAALAAKEIERLESELAGQEDKYAAQVRQVKVEHDKLVEDAYHRAKDEANAQHSKELNELRTRSDTAVNEVGENHRKELAAVNDAHREALESATRPLENKINTLTIEANAARDDLAKAKGTISTQAAELKTLQEQANDLKQALDKAVSSPRTTTPSAEIESLRNDLRETKDDFTALREVYQSMQENFAATVNNHKTELEEAAKGRVQALAALESKHEAEKARFIEERASLLRKVEDEREAKDRAIRSPPATPRHSRVISNGSRDNLERLHHANDARLTQLETEHKQAIAHLTISLMEVRDEKERMVEEMEDKITILMGENKQLAEELERKTMELSFQGEDLNDTQDEVKQLQDELERLKATMSSA
ncbi:hypothetical protein V565_053270 [Rhizoctonia solani 123E]|uniref:Uncharacterized protein n=1 Tax=Rhizoctonia solani 123E TaxID=1423351 RepID=A0A074S4Y7_9AGAM|nr:hypothetical protein V565_053270 [Rhizoctonia solani 123E]